MNKPPLHILFTINCEPPPKKGQKVGPATWEASSRSIEGFCDRVLAAGFVPTLFLSAHVADEHAPMLEELAGRGAELALYVHPRHLGDGRYTNHLGTYSDQMQHELVAYALDWFQQALELRPQSFRSADFSADDATYGVLYELGFRQGSLSVPGSEFAQKAVRWLGAPEAAHYVDPDDRLQAGSLPFLEVPVTSNPDVTNFSGLAADLCIELGDFEEWHRPIIDRWVAEMEQQQAAFRTLCVYTHNRFAYSDAVTHSETLERMLDYFEALGREYQIAPVTVAGAHTAWLRRT